MARFSTWVWSIARHHLLTASTRSRESPEVSLEALAEAVAGEADQGIAAGVLLPAAPAPALARRTVGHDLRVAELAGKPLAWVSVGPGREQTFQQKN